MLFSSRETLEDRIVETVLARPLTMQEIHVRLASTQKRLSLRAVYKATSHLLAAGVLLRAGKRVRIDEEWSRRACAALQPALSTPLAPGERVSYVFTSIGHLDAFWKTIALQLERYEVDGQIFFYNPHDFWAYVPEREESERIYYEHFAKERVHAFFTVGGDSVADREFKRTYQNEYLQIDMNRIGSLARTTHLTILGDFIISVRISKAMASHIDKLYEGQQSTKEMSEELARAYAKPGNIRFIMENNPLRAKKLRRQLSKNFYFGPVKGVI